MCNRQLFETACVAQPGSFLARQRDMLSLLSKRAVLALATGVALMVPTVASAANYSFTPNPADLYDLDHHYMYTWRVDGVNLNGGTITSATISIANIYNWDTNPAELFIHLLDTAVNAGVASYQDNTTGNTLYDNFYYGRVGYSTLVGGSSVGNTLLTSPTAYVSGGNNQLSNSPQNWSYNLTSGQMAILGSYIATGGNFALGFDSDCHFFNDGITFSFTTSGGTSTVPEPASLTLLGLGIAGAVARRRQLKAKAL